MREKNWNAVIKLVGLILIICAFDSYSQIPKVKSGLNEPPLINSEPSIVKTSVEVNLSYAVLVFGVIAFVSLILVFLLKKDVSSSFIKFFPVTLIIIGSLFLVTAGYSNTQIAPIIGLLGTIAGYLLGKNVDAK